MKAFRKFTNRQIRPQLMTGSFCTCCDYLIGWQIAVLFVDHSNTPPVFKFNEILKLYWYLFIVPKSWLPQTSSRPRSPATSNLPRPGNSKCDNESCVTCEHLVEGTTFRSTMTGKDYRFVPAVSCEAKNVIYLVTVLSTILDSRAPFLSLLTT